MRKVREKIEIKCKPDLVIRAFTEFSMLKDWWQVDRCLIEKQKGGCFVLAWQISDQGFGYVSCGTVSRFNPEKRLKVYKMVYLNPERPILGPMTLDIRVKSVEGKSRMRLIQAGYQMGPDWDWYYDAVKAAWPEVLQSLKTYLEDFEDK